MEIPFPGAERIELKVQSRLSFFRKMLPALPDFEDTEFVEICIRLDDDDHNYFEIPIYGPVENPEEAEPVAILVFERKVSIDIVNPELKAEILGLVRQLGEARTGKTRPITKDDWLRRAVVLEKEAIIQTLENHR